MAEVEVSSSEAALDGIEERYFLKPNSSSSGIAEQVQHHVVHEISAGRLHQGDRLTERDLAAALHVSHVPVREAIKLLAHQGWLDHIPQVGTFVRKFGYDEVLEIFYLRMTIESLTVRLVARKCTADQRSVLEELLGVMKVADGAQDLDSHVRADHLFHRFIVRSTLGQRLIDLFDSIFLQSTFIGYAFESADEFFQSHAIERDRSLGHATLFEAIVGHDGDAAEQIIRDHIRTAASMRSIHDNDLW